MTEQTPKTADEGPTPAPAQAGAGSMHPGARLLFAWVDHPRTGRWIFRGVGLLSLILLAGDLLIRREAYPAVAEAAAFYGLFGFGAVILALLACWPVRHLLGRSEDYYGEDTGATGEAGTEPGA